MTVHEHTLKAFDDDIEGIRGAVLSMGDLVEKQFSDAVAAARSGDLQLIASVLERERIVNSMQIQADLLCNRMIAKRQPIAIDLREVVGAIHIVNDLERIGDEAKKIAIKGARLAAFPDRESLPLDELVEMGQAALRILLSAKNAYLEHDTKEAQQVRPKDAEVDRYRDVLLEQLLSRMVENSAGVSAAMDVAFIIQSIERVGDHAKNIAEHVIAIVEGIDMRHTKADPGGSN